MRIARLACHIPPLRVETDEIISSGGGRSIDARAFVKLFGIARVAAADASDTIEECFAPALDRLARTLGGLAADTLIYVHGVPSRPETQQSCMALLQQSHALFKSIRSAFEINQYNCAGVFWAMQMAKQLLTSGEAKRVVIVAGDSLAQRKLCERYVPGCTIIGDAFAVLLLDMEEGGPRVDEIYLKHLPEFSAGLNGTRHDTQRFFRGHDAMVRDALNGVGFSWHGPEKLLPHNVNRLVWTQFSRRHQMMEPKIDLGLVESIGHCYTTDPLLLLERYIEKTEGGSDYVTLLSVGIGAYVGACRINLSQGSIYCKS